MDRRNFLKNVLAGGAVGAGALAGCATTGTGQGIGRENDGEIPSVDIDAYVAKLDSVMGAIHRENYFADLVAAANPGATHDPEDIARREVFARKALATLTLTGMFRDLNAQDQQHPAIQARMWASLEDMTDTLSGVQDMLTSMPQAARDQLRERLRNEPALMDRVAEALDAKSEVIEVPTKRRQHLRRLMGQVGWRLREQDPSLLIDDAVSKVSRVAQRAAQSDPNANNGVTTMQPVQVSPAPQPGQQPPPPGQPVAQQPPPPPGGPVQPAPTGSQAQGQWVQNGAGQWVWVAAPGPQPVQVTVTTQPGYAPQPGYGAPPPGYVAPQPGYAYVATRPPRPHRNGRGFAIAGAIGLGLGVAAGATGWVLVTNNGGAWVLGAFLLTAAAILLILGIVFGIIGLARGLSD